VREKTLYDRACGLADRAHDLANTTNTQFGIASGTKGFTALTGMSLALDGPLDLNSRVRSVLGDDLELIDSAVTVEHLLTHTSGIGDYLDEPEHEMSARQLVSPEEFRTALFWGEEKTAGLILEQGLAIEEGRRK
jgi:CubicO group peptidase (beta-lactamase class C family)